MQPAKILSTGIAVPQFKFTQSNIKEFIQQIFADDVRQLPRLLPVFDHADISTRYFAQPLAWYADPHTFAEANQCYESIALTLSIESAQQAIERAGITPSDIGAIILVSSTGIATPTLDAKLITALNLPNHTIRLPIWGLGCAGGAAGIARANELAQALPNQAILLIAVELCSLTFQRQDYSKSNFIATSLFADGAAAAVIAANGNGPKILGSMSTLFTDSEDVMGWRLTDTGLKVRFSRDIPTLINRFLPQLMTEAYGKWNVNSAEIKHYIVHPGGPKVLNAYAESLNINDALLTEAYHVLNEFGNMSSASVLFVLNSYLSSHVATNDYGILLAMGPGFSAEQILFQW